MNKNSKSQYRVNGQIHARTVALINADGKMVGEYSTNVALQLAREVNLDLVEINPNANPPLAKIVDYSKLKYREQQKEKKARAAKASHDLKEVRIRPKTGEHDLETKAKAAIKFLDKGHQLRVTVMMRGRENARKAEAQEFLMDFAQRLKGHGEVVGRPSNGDRTISVTLNPIGEGSPSNGK